MNLKIFLSCFTALFCHSVYAAGLDVYIAEYPPFQIINEDKHHSGFAVELFDHITKISELDVQYIAVPWVRAKAMVAKQTDSILFTMARTPEREKIYEWVATVYVVNEGVFALKSREDIKINSLTDVHQYSLALPRGDVSVNTLNIFPDHTDGVYIVEHQEQCIKMLGLKRVDLNYNNDVGFFNAAKMLGFKPSNFKQVFVTGQTELGIVANKNTKPESINKIRIALDALKQNGVYSQLQNKWFGEPDESRNRN